MSVQRYARNESGEGGSPTLRTHAYTILLSQFAAVTVSWFYSFLNPYNNVDRVIKAVGSRWDPITRREDFTSVFDVIHQTILMVCAGSGKLLDPWMSRMKLHAKTEK